MADIIDRRPGGGGAGGVNTTYRDQGNGSFSIDVSSLGYGWDGSVWQKLGVSASGNLKVDIAEGGGTGGGPADVATSIAASEADGGRQKVTAALRAWDTSQAAGSQLVALKGDQTNGLWVNVKTMPAGGATTSITNSFIVVNQGTSPWQTSISGTVPVTFSGTTSLAGTVPVTQSTSPWIVQGGSVSITGTVATSISGTVPVTGAFFQGTQPVSGTVTANQGTSPWVIQGGSVSITGTVATSQQGTVAVTQSTSPWVVSGSGPFIENLTSLAGTAIQTSTGNSGAGTQRVVIAADQIVSTSQQGTVTVVQGTSPWIINGGSVSISGTVTTSQSGTTTIGNTVNVSQAGSFSVTQGTNPWLIAGGNVSIAGTVTTSISGTVTTAATLAAGTAAIGDVNLSPVARGGWNTGFFPALSAVTSVSGSAAGKFGGYQFINLNSTPAYIQVFDQSAAPTVGTTYPTFSIPIPANATPTNGAAAVVEIANGVAIANKIWLAAATTATSTGASAVATALAGFVLWK